MLLLLLLAVVFAARHDVPASDGLLYQTDEYRVLGLTAKEEDVFIHALRVPRVQATGRQVIEVFWLNGPTWTDNSTFFTFDAAYFNAPTENGKRSWWCPREPIFVPARTSVGIVGGRKDGNTGALVVPLASDSWFDFGDLTALAGTFTASITRCPARGQRGRASEELPPAISFYIARNMSYVPDVCTEKSGAVFEGELDCWGQDGDPPKGHARSRDK